jgi:hypothetical protein
MLPIRVVSQPNAFLLKKKKKKVDKRPSIYFRIGEATYSEYIKTQGRNRAAQLFLRLSVA